jgi:hypothetical protein
LVKAVNEVWEMVKDTAPGALPLAGTTRKSVFLQGSLGVRLCIEIVTLEAGLEGGKGQKVQMDMYWLTHTITTCRHKGLGFFRPLHASILYKHVPCMSRDPADVYHSSHVGSCSLHSKLSLNSLEFAIVPYKTL